MTEEQPRISPTEEERLADAVDRQSFKKRKESFEKKGDIQSAQFLRKGVAGDWSRFLDEGMLRLIKEKHDPVMEEMGYVVEGDYLEGRTRPGRE